MKIPTTQRLIVEDFPNQKDWVAPMFSVINQFITVAVQALKGSLTFADNIQGQEQVFDFVYSSETASLPKKMKWKLADKPRALYVVEATEETSSTARASVIVLASWIYADDGTVTVDGLVKVTTAGVSTLTAGKRYKIRVRVTP